MLGIIKVIQDDLKAIFIEFPDKCKFKEGEQINVSSEKKKRTLKQNALYWAFLTWLIHPFGGDMQSAGHFSTDGLHENLKAYTENNAPHDFPYDNKFSTRELTKEEFTRWFDWISQDLIVDKLGVDTSGFWAEYEKYGKWIEYNNDDFRRFMDEKVAPTPF